MRVLLPAQDAETIRSSKSGVRMGKLVNRVRYGRCIASLGQLPETTPPARHGRPTRGRRYEGFGQSIAIDSIGTRCYRLLEGETFGLDQGHPSVRVRGCGIVVSRN